MNVIFIITADANAANNLGCQGRTLRRVRESRLYHEFDDIDTLLHDSLVEEKDTTEVGNDNNNKDEKFFFTLIRTASTTVTITTFSTNRSVTVSASAMCTFANIALNFC